VQDAKSPNVLEYFKKGKIDLAININIQKLEKDVHDHETIRRSAIDHNIPLFTNAKKAELFIKALVEVDFDKIPVKAWSEYI